MNLRIAFAVVLSTMLAACSASQSANKSSQNVDLKEASALRPLTPDERGADFDQLLQLFKTYYGPYQYKESRFGYKIEDLANSLKARAQSATSDEEFAGTVMQLSAALKDGHVQIQIENTTTGISRYKIPIVITPIAGKAIVADIAKEIAIYSEIKVGDEILTVDGQSPFEILKTALKYRSSATDLSNQHSILYSFYRPSYMKDLLPANPFASVKAVRADGTLLFSEIPWEVEKYNKDLDKVIQPAKRLNLTVPLAADYNAVMPAHRLQMGQVNPIFLTPQVQSTFKFIPVSPSEPFRLKYGLTEKETPPIYAALYRYQGKNVLLVRSATFYPQDFRPSVYMKAYQALMDEYQPMADVLVLDQTHNPGGSYCADFYNLFAQAGDVQGVETVRADRKWVNDFKINWPNEMIAEDPNVSPADVMACRAAGSIVEKAYDEGKLLSEPLPLFTSSTHAVLKKFQWKKPMLVLIDSLAGSCADIFPMLVKANKHSKLFGETTMGLGGNVEEVGILNNSRIHVSMTRGLFFPFREDGKYQLEDYVENNGVKPDYSYSFTVEDFRAGLVDYVKSFSDKAVEQIK